MAVNDTIKRMADAAVLAGNAKHVGDTVLWDVKSIEIPRKDLRALFAKEGFEECVVDEMSPATALGRAKGRKLPRTIEVREIPRHNKDTTIAFAVYEVRAREGEGGDEFVCGARVRIENDANARPVVIARAPEGADAIGGCLLVAEEIAKEANKLITFAENNDVTGSCIKALAGPMQGYSMKDKSGVYFIRASHSPTWQRLAASLEPFGFTDRSVPVIAVDGDPRTMKASATIVKAGLEDDLAKLAEEFAKIGEKTRESTIEKRAQDCDALIAKGELYAEILGDKFEAVKAAILALKSQFQAKLDEEASDAFTFGDSPKASAAA